MPELPPSHILNKLMGVTRTHRYRQGGIAAVKFITQPYDPYTDKIKANIASHLRTMKDAKTDIYTESLLMYMFWRLYKECSLDLPMRRVRSGKHYFRNFTAENARNHFYVLWREAETSAQKVIAVTYLGYMKKIFPSVLCALDEPIGMTDPLKHYALSL